MSKYRHEYKYMIDARDKAIIQCKLATLLNVDSHANASGYYIVRSAYFDDIYDTCLNENIQGCDPRSKFRVRYYNDSSNKLMLEKKSKYKGMCLKESCEISIREYEIFLAGSIPLLVGNDSDMKKRLFTEIAMRGLVPRTIVTYERVPYVYSGGNVRITFDRKITSSEEVERFLSCDYAERPVLPLGQCVMEVKWDEVMPLHIKNAIQMDNLNWTAFSKYYTSRIYHL